MREGKLDVKSMTSSSMRSVKEMVLRKVQKSHFLASDLRG
jgi:hypothetical protein